MDFKLLQCYQYFTFQKTITLLKFEYFPEICYHTFHNPTLSNVNVDPTSEVCLTAMLTLLMVEN